jgi:hypothetical protein
VDAGGWGRFGSSPRRGRRVFNDGGDHDAALYEPFPGGIHTSCLAVLAWRYDMKVAKRRLRNKMRKLIGRRRAIARRLKEIDNALAELEQLSRQPWHSL